MSIELAQAAAPLPIATGAVVVGTRAEQAPPERLLAADPGDNRLRVLAPRLLPRARGPREPPACANSAV
jgi:hypothetical protein